MIKFKKSFFRVVALLPLKKNSVRIKNKNFINFCGKPLFKWTLDTLKSVKEIDKIVINTDAKNKLITNGLVESNRVVIRERKSKICGDHVSMNLIIEDDIKYEYSDIYLMTHTTNPLLSKKTILDCIRIFLKKTEKQKFDSLFTVNKYQTRFYDYNGKPKNHKANNLIKTQNLDPWFEENSNLYIFTKNSFKKSSSRIGNKPILFTTPKINSIDIDTSEDLELASIILKNKKNK
jgi:CMP-N-acetylneuraminic acid synthetase